MSKYTKEKGQQGDMVLNIDGIQSICPYVQALPMQGSYGQIQIMRLPCTSSCPHAKVTDTHWEVSCSGAVTSFELEPKEQEPEVIKSQFSIV